MSDSRLPAAITTYLERSALDGRVIPLTGDASDRRYFRIIPRDGRPFVLALHAQPFEPGSLPFVNVAELFAALPLPVPRVLGEAPDLGVLALDDLGDVTLQAHLGSASAAEHQALYERAVDHIVCMQVRGRELADPRFIPYRLAFDVEKLMWEMDYFVRHFLESYRGVELDALMREELRTELGAVVSELAAEPRVLCHRDYHSRNLMILDEHLYVIDFQDARLGPDTYDLVSLLRDSYVDLPETEVDQLIARYLSATDRADQSAEFRRRFDLMAMQRNIKALGTFGFQTVARGNPVYAQYVPRTLRFVRENLTRHARFGRLRQLLAGVVPELG